MGADYLCAGDVGGNIQLGLEVMAKIGVLRLLLRHGVVGG